MAEERQNFFQRIVGRIEGAMRPAELQNPHAEAMVERARESEERKVSEASRFAIYMSRTGDKHTFASAAEAGAAFADADAKDRPLVTEVVGNSARKIAHTIAIGYEPSKSVPLLEHVITDQSYKASDRAFWTSYHDRLNERDREASPIIVKAGDWSFDDGYSESRPLVVKTDAGFHAGYEVSHMGGDGPLHYSERSFSSADLALSLAMAYRNDGEVGLDEAVADHEAAVSRISALTSQDRLSLGEHTELSQALSTVGVVPRDLMAGKVDALDLYSSDHKAQSAVLKALADRPEGFEPHRLTADALAAGLETRNAVALDAHIAEVYGSEDRYLRQERLTVALDSMARTVENGQQPMFQSHEHMASFRRDLDQTYGAGTMDQLQAGETERLAAAYPSQERRVAIAQALHGMVAGAERSSPSDLERNFAAATLATRLERADWYSDYSDDRNVRQRGREDMAALTKDIAQFAERSPEAADQIARIWAEKAPRDMQSKLPINTHHNQDSIMAVQAVGNDHLAVQDRDR